MPACQKNRRTLMSQCYNKFTLVIGSASPTNYAPIRALLLCFEACSKYTFMLSLSYKSSCNNSSVNLPGEFSSLVTQGYIFIMILGFERFMYKRHIFPYCTDTYTVAERCWAYTVPFHRIMYCINSSVPMNLNYLCSTLHSRHRPI